MKEKKETDIAMGLPRLVQIGVLIAGGILTMLVLSIIFGLTVKQNEMIKNYLHLSAEAYFESIVLTRSWNSNHGGVYVLKKEGVISNPYLKNPDMESRDGRIFTKKNPALMTREISTIARNHGVYQYHITSLEPINPSNIPDEWESRSLESFAEGEKESFVVDVIGSKKVYRFMKPLYVEKGCLDCHDKKKNILGGVRGGISVTLPYAEIEASLKGNQKRMFFLALVILSIMGITLYLLVWQLMRRLNKTIGMLGSEKKKLESAQSEAEEERNKLDNIISCIDADLLLMDTDMKVLWGNKRIRERFPAFDTDVVGKLCYSAYCNKTQLPSFCSGKDVLLSGEPAQREGTITQSDGTTRHYSFTCSPLKDSDGKVTHILELIQDITLKKEKEEELRITKFSMDHAGEAIFWVTPEMRLIYVNQDACRSLGYSNRELLSMGIDDIVSDYSHGSWNTLFKDLKNHGSRLLESSAKTKDGKFFPVEMFLNFVAFEGKEYVVAFIRNVSERRKAESEMRRNVKDLERFTKIVVGRERKMIKLKEEINDMLSHTGKDDKYKISS